MTGHGRPILPGGPCLERPSRPGQRTIAEGRPDTALDGPALKRIEALILMAKPDVQKRKPAWCKIGIQGGSTISTFRVGRVVHKKPWTTLHGCSVQARISASGTPAREKNLGRAEGCKSEMLVNHAANNILVRSFQ